MDEGKVPEMLEFYFGRVNDRFFEALRHLSPNNQTATFIDFLTTDYESRLMRENNLSIHIESGNLYYNGLNTG